MKSEIRLFAALGPGDIVGAHRSQLAGKEINVTSIAFSEQLFAYCHLRQIETLAISSNERIDQLSDGCIAMENRAKPLRHRGGIQFHLSLILYSLYLAVRARRFRADIAIVDSGTTHHFALVLFALLGIPVAINLHNVLWPAGFPPQGIVHRAVRFLNGLLFRYVAAGAIGVSPECERQILSESRRRTPFFQYRCQFGIRGFQLSKPYVDGAFRIAFVGRAEASKGILDIARMAADLKTHATTKVIFDICGEGPALPALKQLVERDGLADELIIHGHLKRDALLEVYSHCHAVIVPTRSSFTEGMPQVCAEAVLTGIPVITSQVANAFDVIGDAAIRAETDDAASYVRAIQSLIQDPELYRRARSECSKVAPQFLDRAQSYPAALDRLLERVLAQPALSDYTVVFSKIE
jgi:glycosyltransferase involved in cell wall biosynthesis